MNDAAGPSPVLDFVLVGPFKTGTSWMDNYLRDHPRVQLPAEVKETFYFSDDQVHARGEDWFRALYPPAEATRLRGEVGPSYFRSEHAVQRIHAVAPACRIVCSLRDPAERLYSHYLHLLQRGEVDAGASFLEVVKARPFLFDSARYSHHIERWQGAFGVEQVSVLRYEDLLDDKQALADALCAGIGVESLPVEERQSRRVNEAMAPSHPRLTRLAYGVARRLRRSGLHGMANFANRSGVRRLLFRPFDERPRLTEDERAHVQTRLRDDLDRLATLTGREFDWPYQSQ